MNIHIFHGNLKGDPCNATTPRNKALIRPNLGRMVDSHYWQPTGNFLFGAKRGNSKCHSGSGKCSSCKYENQDLNHPLSTLGYDSCDIPVDSCVQENYNTPQANPLVNHERNPFIACR